MTKFLLHISYDNSFFLATKKLHVAHWFVEKYHVNHLTEIDMFPYM